MSEEIAILIVEESLPQAEQLKHLLEQHGHRVTVEHDAKLGLASIHKQKPQIVISEVLLPVMDGYSLCREVKADENLKDLPVILLTSLSEAKDIIRGLGCGADNFLTKPYDEKLLVSRIEYMVLNRELRVDAGTQTGLEITFNGEKHFITPDQQQVVDLLISTYEVAVQKNLEVIRAVKELKSLNQRLQTQVKERTSELTEQVAERKVAERALLASETLAEQALLQSESLAEQALFHSETLAEQALLQSETLAEKALLQSETLAEQALLQSEMLADRALLKSETLLQQSQKMEAIGTLAGGVAHDFNNLLTVVLGNTHLALRDLKPDDPLQLRLIEIEKAANRAAVLTRQLLAFSRRQRLERRTINLNHTISEIMKLLRRIIGEDVDVRVTATPGLSAIFADPAQIEQVIMNLAVNARDAMPEGGTLTLETSNITLDETYRRQYPYVAPGRYVQISLSDTGSGIDAETLKHVFEPFFTTKEIDKGTGLGLSMVYGIVKQHDGHINVYSEVGLGTIFKIFLPIVESVVEEGELTIQPPVRGGTETILVAEDEEALRALARNVLEGLGYTVLLANNGEQAVGLYDQNREQIDLLLLDVVMPRMGAIEAYERVRQLGGDPPLIFMTGYSADTVQNRFVKQNQFMEGSDVVVLQKPYNVEGLGRKVREVLDNSVKDSSSRRRVVQTS